MLRFFSVIFVVVVGGGGGGGFEELAVCTNTNRPFCSSV
jgi:hypothetical protein